MGSQVKVYVNSGQITRTADPFNNKLGFEELTSPEESEFGKHL